MLLFAATSVYANNSDILDREIRISLSKATKYQYLRSISDEIGYQFVYDSSVINNDKEIAISPGLYVLREVIPIIAESNHIDIKIVGKHIVLSMVAPKLVNPAIAVKPETPPYTVITGRIFDLFSKEIISSATLIITDAGIGTVSNQDGVFRLAIPDSLKSSTIRISHIGYVNREFTLREVTDGRIDLSLEPKVIPLQEVVIRVINPIQTIQKMLDERKYNYASNPVDLTVFYREAIEHKKKNVDLTETVLNIYKTGYDYEHSNDQVRLMKMRRIIDQQERDTILTKVKAGIYSALMLDVVKHVPDFLEVSPANEFAYTFADMSVVDNRLVYVIAFEQKQHIKTPLFKGQLYIDTDNYALLEAHIEINPEYVEKATSLYVEKRSRNFRLTLRKAAYTLSYRPGLDGLHYLNHVRGDLEFRVRRKRHWFSSTLKVWFEMVNCKVDTENVQPIPRQERFSPRSILSETTHAYDPDFWGGMNVIVPEEELKEFILKNLQ
ncbi:carboxypeptidase-like regulatory domain-containing protein [Bacteroides sp. 519]|uniref:carboxypeptidase-like regulatory domain-containing protein n=1 Tax=Bacteroides sp. 519 TaxID=2302937 RepID=UPI0013D0EC3E|nr:carboxypeptidase-like regulatory domain-containing protein [Bacteroides sp. 519]